METLIQLRGLRREFGTGDAKVVALDGIDLDIATGEYVAIRGTSGSGKSTLLQILGLLDHITAGSYQFAGREVNSLGEKETTRLRNEDIGFVFQSFHLLPDRTALENVRLPLDYRRGGVTPLEPRQILERVGLGHRLTHRPGEMSGGECQRVAIARALVKRPRLVLFDEPTGNLDSHTSADILDLLDEVHGSGQTTMVLVTHDRTVAERADRVLHMEDGRWASCADTGVGASS